MIDGRRVLRAFAQDHVAVAVEEGDGLAVAGFPKIVSGGHAPGDEHEEAEHQRHEAARGPAAPDRSVANGARALNLACAARDFSGDGVGPDQCGFHVWPRAILKRLPARLQAAEQRCVGLGRWLVWIAGGAEVVGWQVVRGGARWRLDRRREAPVPGGDRTPRLAVPRRRPPVRRFNRLGFLRSLPVQRLRQQTVPAARISLGGPPALPQAERGARRRIARGRRQRPPARNRPQTGLGSRMGVVPHREQPQARRRSIRTRPPLIPSRRGRPRRAGNLRALPWGRCSLRRRRCAAVLRLRRGLLGRVRRRIVLRPFRIVFVCHPGYLRADLARFDRHPPAGTAGRERTKRQAPYPGTNVVIVGQG